MVKRAAPSPALLPWFLLVCSKSGALKAERGEHALLSLVDSRRLPVQHPQSGFGAPGSLGDSEGVPDPIAPLKVSVLHAKSFCKGTEAFGGAISRCFRPPSL